MDVKRCNIKFTTDEILGWKLELSGDCQKEMSDIAKLSEKKREYLERRITQSSDSSSI